MIYLFSIGAVIFVLKVTEVMQLYILIREDEDE